MWKISIVNDETGKLLDSAVIDPDDYPDHRKPVKLEISRDGRIMGFVNYRPPRAGLEYDSLVYQK